MKQHDIRKFGWHDPNTHRKSNKNNDGDKDEKNNNMKMFALTIKIINSLSFMHTHIHPR